MTESPTPAMTRCAQLLCIDPSTIDGPMYNRAWLSVQIEDGDYWNALADSGQLHGNVPHASMVAIVYARMADES